MCGVRIELPGGGEIKSSTGSNPIGDISNSVNREVSNAGNSINSAVNAATGGASWEDVAANILTGGLLGYDPKTGAIKAGGITRGADETLGEITGRNQNREAMARAEQLLAEQRAEADRLRQEELERMRQKDVQASRAAGASQRRSLYSAGSNAGSQAFNNLTKDFLGL